jgi:large subunit ribosomal protein L3
MAKLRNKALIAKKIGMTRIFDEEGLMVPVTLLKVEDQAVTKVLTEQKDGYNGYQVGYFVKAEKNLTKADVARLRKVGVEDSYAKFREFRTSEVVPYSVGHKIGAALFEGELCVDVTSAAKGRGFQGAVKRWNNAVGRMTHGSRFHRRPGSLGQNSSPSRVYKNKPQPGQMGGEKVTVRNLKVVKVDAGSNVIAVMGSVPGNRHSFVEIRSVGR